MCPDQEWNPNTFGYRTMIQPTEPPSRGQISFTLKSSFRFIGKLNRKYVEFPALLRPTRTACPIASLPIRHTENSVLGQTTKPAPWNLPLWPQNRGRECDTGRLVEGGPRPSMWFNPSETRFPGGMPCSGLCHSPHSAADSLGYMYYREAVSARMLSDG